MHRTLSVMTVTALIAVWAAGATAQELTLEYSSYLGGISVDYLEGLAVDSGGQMYLAGMTLSDTFPTASAYQPSRQTEGGEDAFLSKFSSSGTALVFSTFLGGSLADACHDLAVDSTGAAYLAGETESTDFPLLVPYQSSAGGRRDAFLTKFLPSGSSLVFSSYFGGSENDLAAGISLDSALRPYIAGQTGSNDFPTRNAYQATFNGTTAAYVDAFLARFESGGSSLSYSTFCGGTEDDWAQAVGVSGSWPCLVGASRSENYPTINCYQSSHGGSYDAFVTFLTSSGSGVYLSSYLGGELRDLAYGVAIDSAGRWYVSGETASADFPTLNAYQPSRAAGSDAFVSAFNPGFTLVYSTYLGGSNLDYGFGVAVDSARQAYVTGSTSSDNFPTRQPYQAAPPGNFDSDAFVACLSSAGSQLVFSSYLGGTGDDSSNRVALDGPGRVYVAGDTASSDFPTRQAYQSRKNGSLNAFVCRLALITPTPASTPSPTPAPTCGPSIPPERCVIQSGDFDGDGASDLAVFRPSAGLWSVRNITRLNFGGSSDQPAPGDYDGDGTAEITIYRASTGLWSVSGVTRAYFGGESDRPAPSDFDGDGSCDIAVFSENAGRWSVRSLTRFYFGATGDWAIPGGYGDDGTAEAALYRVGSGQWMVRGLTRFYFGGSSDWPVPGDYFASGGKIFAIFRPCSGQWALRDLTRIYFGNCFDYPRPGDFNGDGTDDFGIFRDSAGMWSVRNLTRTYFGATGDIPVTR